jgi:hypothetical protein
MALMSRIPPAWPRPLVGTVCAALAVLAAGCAAEGKSKTYPVRGKIVYKGTGQAATQLAGGYVVLEPVGDPKSTQVRGVIDDDGTFSLGSVIDSQSVGGVLPGEYRARIQLADGGRRPASRGPIDPRFLSYDKSGLRMVVKAETNHVTLEVEEPRR